MANIVEQTPNTADKTISLLNGCQLDEKETKKVDYSIVRGKVILSSLVFINIKLSKFFKYN